MRVTVNGENRELHVYDRETGRDYAKPIVCSQEQLETDMYGEFVLTEEEYAHWTELLATAGVGRPALCLKRCRRKRRMGQLPVRRNEVHDDDHGDDSDGKYLYQGIERSLGNGKSRMADREPFFQDRRKNEKIKEVLW